VLFRSDLELIRRCRAATRAPLLVLAASTRERDLVAALDCGADDYLTQPLDVPALGAKLRVALRRAGHRNGTPTPAIFQTGDLRIDLERQWVTRGGRPVHLARREFQVLAVLVQHAGATVPYARLLEAVPDGQPAWSHDGLRECIRCLRRKLEPDPSAPRHLLTQEGLGYGLAGRR
jgi:two-component system, OmpR family, KDP operon response regulator KdpE